MLDCLEAFSRSEHHERIGTSILARKAPIRSTVRVEWYGAVECAASFQFARSGDQPAQAREGGRPERHRQGRRDTASQHIRAAVGGSRAIDTDPTIKIWVRPVIAPSPDLLIFELQIAEQSALCSRAVGSVPQ